MQTLRLDLSCNKCNIKYYYLLYNKNLLYLCCSTQHLTYNFLFCYPILIKLRASRNPVVYHQKIQSFLAVLLVYRRDQHTAGINAHHLPRRQVYNSDTGLAHQLFRFIIIMDSA